MMTSLQQGLCHRSEKEGSAEVIHQPQGADGPGTDFLNWVDLGPESSQGAATAWGHKRQGPGSGKITMCFYIGDFLMAKRRLEKPKGHPNGVSKAVTKDHRPYDSIHIKCPVRKNYRDRKYISDFQELGEVGKENMGFPFGKGCS